MNIDEYLILMKFPKEWRAWGMLPNERYLEELIATYEEGMEEASEHDRNGVFHWWLKQNPTEEHLVKLAKLTFLDPDQVMAKDVRSYIRRDKNCSNIVETVLNNNMSTG